MSQLAPIILFVYNRPWHTRQTVNALLENKPARLSDLIIYSDAAKNEAAAPAVKEVRDYIGTINGFKSVTIRERETNLGLANSIIDGVTTVLNEQDRVIVLEDDLVTSPYFLNYMNSALERYADDERVISIHGYVYPVSEELPEAFFLPGADCWGWATWRRGWDLFNPDGQQLLDELERRELLEPFDFNGAYPYSNMLKKQIKGTNDSWAVRWYASAFLQGKLTLYPGRSLVHNIGNDSSGTHCGVSDSMDAQVSATPIELDDIEVVASEEGKRAFEVFLWSAQGGLLKKVYRKTLGIVNNLVR